MSKPIVVLAEIRSGQLKKSTLEAVAAAASLAEKTGGEIVVLALGDRLEQACQELAQTPAKRVVAVASPALARYSGDAFARAAREQLEKIDPAAVLMTHTAMAKDLMPRLAAAYKTAMVSDATELHSEDGKLGGTKPVYAGKAYLKALAQRDPLLATIRPNSFAPVEGSGAQVEDAETSVQESDPKAVVTEIAASASKRVPLQEAKVVVSGGRGLKGPENFHLVEELAAAFGEGVATVGASRAVVDAGWRPHREQVGQTGKVVAPQLYVACGISGAIQHLAGMRTSATIVAINRDADAPIFKVADYGIVGDVFEVLPALTQAVKKAVADKG